VPGDTVIDSATGGGGGPGAYTATRVWCEQAVPNRTSPKVKAADSPANGRVDIEIAPFLNSRWNRCFREAVKVSLNAVCHPAFAMHPVIQPQTAERRPESKLITSTTRASTNKMWMNPPIV